MADQRTIKFTLVVDGNGVVREVQTTSAAFAAMGSAAQAAAGQTQQGLAQVEAAAKSAQASQAGFIAGLREQVALYGKSEGDVLRYRAAQAGVAQQASMLILQLENQKAAHQQAAIAAMQEQAAQREAAAAKRAAEQASEAFVASLREQVATLGMSRTELLAYRAAQLGVAAEAAPMIARLGQAEQVTGKYGMTAGQLSQAMRMLPMQMTDVVTSLASGMPVWMVAIQQGGQLRDSFGGILPVFSAILSLITPMSLAIGALAVVAGLTALAFVQGQREASAYSQALILTGNYAGNTSGQLGDMARAMAGVSGTQAANAAALAEVAGSGRIAGSVLRDVAAAAVAMESATGKAVSETVAEFVRLGEDPAKASAKLNEQYHYLTASVYAQIAALEKAGKTDEAAELAQRTYAIAMRERADQVRQSLGTLETAWAAIGRTARRAWDDMLNVGREQTTQQKLDDAIARLAAARKAAAEPPMTGAFAATPTVGKGTVAMLESQVQLLKEMRRLEEQGAAAQAANAKANEKAIAQQVAQADILKRYATDSEKLKDALDEAAKAFGGVVPPDVEARIRASFKGLGAAAKKELDEAAKAIKAYQNLVSDLAGKDSGLNTDFNDKLEILRKGWKASADSAEGYRAAVQALIAQQPFAVKAAEQQKKWQEEQDAARKKSMQDAVDAVEDYLDAQLKAAGAAAEAAESALKSAEAEYAQYGLSKSAVVELTILKLKEAQVGRDASTAEYASRQREIEAMEKLAGVLRKGEARDAAVQAANDGQAAWQAFADDIDRELTSSLQRAFDAGKGFGESFFQSLRNMAKTAAIKVAVQLVSGGSSAGGTLVNLLGGGNGGSGSNLIGTANSANSLLNLGGTAAGIWGSSAAYGAALGTTSIGAGSQAAMLASQTSAFGAEGLAATASAAGGTAGSAMSAIASAAPYIAAVLAVYALASQYTKGETRTGGQYAVGTTPTGSYDSYATFLQGPSGGQIQSDQVKGAINATVAGINATLKAVGSAATLTGFQAALEASGNGRGGVYAGGTLSTGATFGELGLGGGRSNYNGTLYETTSATTLDSAQALQNFTTDLLQATIQALQAATDIPKAISDMLAGVDAESLSAEAASALLANVNAMAAFSSAANRLPFEQLKNLSFTAADSLFKLMGGVEGLNTALGTYYDAFYTDSERQQQAVSNVQRVFSDLGLTMPSLTQSGEAARAQFRALVEAQDLSTEEGRRNYAALLQVSGAFAELAPLGVQAAASVDAMTGEVKVLSQTMIDLRREQVSLQDQVDRLTMSQADYRAKLVASYTAEEQAAAAANFALADRIAALQAEQSAAQTLAGLEVQLLQLEGNTAEIRRRELAALPASAQAMQQLIYARTDEIAAAQQAAQAAQARAAADQAIAQQRAGLEQQILQLGGNTAAIRAAELAALDASLRPLQERIYALQDEAAAAALAQQAIQQAAQRAEAILQQRTSLETQWLQLIGDTTTLRQRELDAMDPSNRALQQLIWARQDQAAADQAAAQAAQAAAQALVQTAQQAAQAAQAAADKVAGEGMSLYKRLLQAQGDVTTLRAMELAELDPANRALQQQIYALEDQQSALTTAAAAQQKYASAVADAAQFLVGVGGNITSYFGRLRATSAGLGTPASQLAAASSQFEQQFALAQSGNRDALSGITGYADQYLTASRATAGSSLDVQRLIAQLETRLTALPASVRPEQLIVDAITTSTSTTTANAGNLNAAAIAAAYAESQRGIAAARAEADRLIAAAQAQAASITSNATAQAGTVASTVSATGQATINALAINFDRLDTTADGLLSADELRAALGPLATDSVLRQVFATLDADGDGQISRLEAIQGNTSGLALAIAGALGGSFDRLDTSVNGLLDRGELVAALGPLASDSVLRQVFATLDVDGDGQISRLEAIKGSTASAAYEALQAALRLQVVVANTQQAAGNALVVSDNVKSLTFNTLTFDAASGLRSVFDATKLAAEASANIWNRVTNGELGAYVTLARVQNANAAYDIGSNFMRAYSEWGGGGIKVESPFLTSISQSTASTSAQAQNTAIQAAATVQRVDQVREQSVIAASHLAVINTAASLSRDYLQGFFTGSPMRVYSFNRTVADGYSVFAAGGAFTNSIVRRPTTFPMGLMGEAGDEGILPLANVGGVLGVNAAGIGASDARLIAEVRALRADLADLQRAAQATAINTGKAARGLDRMERDGLTVRTDADQPLATVAA